MPVTPLLPGEDHACIKLCASRAAGSPARFDTAYLSFLYQAINGCHYRTSVAEMMFVVVDEVVECNAIFVVIADQFIDSGFKAFFLFETPIKHHLSRLLWGK
jgi:hypothetical protein